MNISSFSDMLLKFGLAFVPALFGIICHEVAHGFAAYKLGDPTAKMLGRLTLNPVKHIDPVGFGVFAFTALFSPIIFGWAKPVPVQSRYFRNPRRDMVLVSFAGPFTNFCVALLFAVLLKLSHNLVLSGIGEGSVVLSFLQQSFEYGIIINCVLAWFNLLPIPPLDGSHIVAGILPPAMAQQYESVGRYGMFIIVLLLATGMFSKLMWPLVRLSLDVITFIVGI